MNSGLSENVVSRIRKVFSQHLEIEKAILYGSRAKGNYKPGSDIDLALVGDDLTLKVISQIQNELEEEMLPYQFDISVFSTINHPDLIDHIRRAGVLFYEKKP